MEDRRIKKTKKNLKRTLIDMLQDMPFERISVTELCTRADTSRITFYTHYSDKYALVDDIFMDMIEAGTKIYEDMQIENNPQMDPVVSYCNVLDSILILFYDNLDFFRHTYVLQTVEMHTAKESRVIKLKYSTQRIAGFLCYGMVGFINEGHSENVPLKKLYEDARQLLMDLLKSDILVSF